MSILGRLSQMKKSISMDNPQGRRVAIMHLPLAETTRRTGQRIEPQQNFKAFRTRWPDPALLQRCVQSRLISALHLAAFVGAWRNRKNEAKQLYPAPGTRLRDGTCLRPMSPPGRDTQSAGRAHPLGNWTTLSRCLSPCSRSSGRSARCFWMHFRSVRVRRTGCP